MIDYTRVFPEAQTVLRMLLQEVDRVAPGLLNGVYVTGSLALDDPRPGKSDIDLVLMRPDGVSNEATMEALGPAMELIRTMYPEPTLDGIVLSRGDLAAGPSAIDGARPVIFEGRLELREDASGRNPVTWQTLRQGGITWRGTPIPQLELHHDPAELRAWTRGNLESYWRPWLARSARVPVTPGSGKMLDEFVEWGVLGVTRLHATLATGEIVSKTGAGEYALKAFPERWHKIIREAIDIRSNPERKKSLYGRNAWGRRKDARAYVAMVTEDALARFP
jgi:hypothetical protein